MILLLGTVTEVFRVCIRVRGRANQIKSKERACGSWCNSDPRRVRNGHIYLGLICNSTSVSRATLPSSHVGGLGEREVCRRRPRRSPITPGRKRKASSGALGRELPVDWHQVIPNPRVVLSWLLTDLHHPLKFIFVKPRVHHGVCVEGVVAWLTCPSNQLRIAGTSSRSSHQLYNLCIAIARQLRGNVVLLV